MNHMNPPRNYDKTAANMCKYIIKYVVYLCHECDVCNVVLYWSEFYWELTTMSNKYTFFMFFSLAISYVTNIYWHQKVAWATNAWQMRRLCCTKMGYCLSILLAPTVHWHVFLLWWHLTENYVTEYISLWVSHFFCLGIELIVPLNLNEILGKKFQANFSDWWLRYL